VEEVEQIFTEKFTASVGSSAVDPFLDFSTAMFTSDLDAHLGRLEASGTPYLAAAWPYAKPLPNSRSSPNATASSFSSMTGFSVFVQVGGSQLIVELVATASSQLEASVGTLVELEQRVTDDRLAAFAATPPDGLRLALASVNRAASSHELITGAIHSFYTKGVGATVTASSTTTENNGESASYVSKECYLWPQAGSDVCFTARPGVNEGSSSYFSVADMEAMLASVHSHWLTDAPACSMDRWVDNHYAVDLGGDFQGLLDYVLAAGMPFTCGSSPYGPTPGAHYVFDPTGWGIQLDVPFSTTMPGCEELTINATVAAHATRPHRLAPNGDDTDDDWVPSELAWCEGGTCPGLA
jgi:hypothetical protein